MRAWKNYQSQYVDPQVGFMSKICANNYLNTDLWHHEHLNCGGGGLRAASGWGPSADMMVWPSSQIMMALKRLPWLQW